MITSTVIGQIDCFLSGRWVFGLFGLNLWRATKVGAPNIPVGPAGWTEVPQGTERIQDLESEALAANKLQL